MSKPVTCPRCHGPATMISKAPRGESGDVIRCAVDAECAALTDAAREVDATYAGVVDTAQDFVRHVGKPRDRNADITISGYAYAEIRMAVEEWKAAGQALHDATVKISAARAKAAA